MAARSAIFDKTYGNDNYQMAGNPGRGLLTTEPEAANMPPTLWQTEVLAPGIWARAVPRIRTPAMRTYGTCRNANRKDRRHCARRRGDRPRRAARSPDPRDPYIGGCTRSVDSRR